MDQSMDERKEEWNGHARVKIYPKESSYCYFYFQPVEEANIGL